MGVGHIEVDDFLDEVLLRIRSHFEGEEKIVDFVPQGSLRKTVDLSLPIEGRGIDSVMADIDEFLRYSVRTNHPGFMNPLWGGMNIAAFAG